MDRKDMARLYLGEQPFQMRTLQKYLDQGREYRVFSGEALCCNDSSIFLYYIKRGSFKLCVQYLNGELNDYCYCKEGTTIQINPLLIRAEPSDPPFIIAVENSILVGFSLEQIYELIKQDADLFREYVDTSSSYSTLLKQHLVITSSLTANQRLLTWLDKLCSFHEPDSKGFYAIPCSLTQQQIADYLCIHLTTCNKLLHALTNNKVIRREKKVLYVCNRSFIQEHLENSWLEL